jgi:hypothetical protein
VLVPAPHPLQPLVVQLMQLVDCILRYRGACKHNTRHACSSFWHIWRGIAEDMRRVAHVCTCTHTCNCKLTMYVVRFMHKRNFHFKLLHGGCMACKVAGWTCVCMQACTIQCDTPCDPSSLTRLMQWRLQRLAHHIHQGCLAW